MDGTRRVVVITGASGGIGSVLARRFAATGFAVVINYLHGRERALAIQETIIRQNGPDASIALQGDVSNRSQVREMFSHIQEKYGRTDVLVNMAGMNIDGPFVKMSDDAWNTVLSTILTGTFICSQEFALRFQGEEGHIINIGALTAIRGRAHGANYCSARAGVMALTKCLALELAPRIRVNCITPGWINTEEVMQRYHLHREENCARAVRSIPMGRLGTADDVSRLIHFIVNESTYITGQSYLVDGGMLMR